MKQIEKLLRAKLNSLREQKRRLPPRNQTLFMPPELIKDLERVDDEIEMVEEDLEEEI